MNDRPDTVDEIEGELETAKLRLAAAQTKDESRAAWGDIERLKAEIRERAQHHHEAGA